MPTSTERAEDELERLLRQAPARVANVSRNSPAAKRGLQPGDRILAANGHEVTEPEALGREVLRGYDRGGVLLVVQRGRYAYNLSFPL